MMKKFLGILALMGIAICAQGKPAMPGVLKMTQPDGTTLSVVLRGDEHRHCYFTTDGYPIVASGEYFYYAQTDSRGLLTATDIRVSETGMRTPSEIAYLSGCDKAALSSAALKRVHGATRAIPDGKNPGLYDYSFPTTGSPKVLVILVEFSDKKFKLNDPCQYFGDMLNKDGFDEYGGTGSCLEYFRDNSNGVFTPVFDLYGPLTLSKSYKYYGANDSYGYDKYPQKVVSEACKMLDDTVDFTEYDNDGDGYVDNVYVFYAGEGENACSDSNTIWPHSWSISESGDAKCRLDNVYVDRYAMSNEWFDGAPDGIGTICHEFSHVLGLPDLYSTESYDYTVGEWSLMDAGSYNNDSRTPPYMSVYERYSLGWISPETLEKGHDYVLAPISDNKGYIIHTDNELEFFLIENRQQKGNDAYVPGHGLLLWHVDYNEEVWIDNVVNNTKSHQYVDLVEADNTQSEKSADGDAFPGSRNVTSFGNGVSGHLAVWKGSAPDIAVYDIEESDDIVKFNTGKVVGADDVIVSADSRITGRTLIASEATEVYDVYGRMLWQGCGSYEFPDAGIYVIRSAGSTFKTIIR